MPSPSLPISALPEIRELIDGAENILKADISRIKKLLADPDATLPPSIVAFTLQEAKDALTGQMRAETSFRALFITRRYCFETQFHARRGANVQIVAGRAPNP